MGKRLTEYRIISGTRADVERDVNVLLGKGYKLVGGVAFSDGWLHQAVVWPVDDSEGIQDIIQNMKKALKETP